MSQWHSCINKSFSERTFLSRGHDGRACNLEDVRGAIE